MTIEDSAGFMQQANLCISCGEVYGIIIKHEPSCEWQHDSMEIIVGDRIYHIYRCPPMIDELPFFNVRILEDEK
jgi:hypothetical protein